MRRRRIRWTDSQGLEPLWDEDTRGMKDRLMYWLNESRDAKCGLLHDQVFSILELAAEGAAITADYSMPLFQLACQVIEASDCRICLCEVCLVTSTEYGSEWAVNFDEITVQVPIQRLANWWSRSMALCDRAKRGTPRPPVRIKRGNVPHNYVKR
ncbi:hypothetical protein BU25DRAFT_422071 [Macroventuria anomochaeta]|uniref:Uncharacterized protein n=1 Tax=Macroventuria anomochaeta TaxID=301207 RepID=A0ACB6S242_9PLEO|nr:uncharacterized protein BU25DRAFT_422071 [Macroventuria anomochaeta]KAF2627202.1 hypothetical protein BU25DRAFT_422071 [Macroventuria anomochaeta]